MISKDKKSEFIFIIPHLKVNTTSTSRFKSIIKEIWLRGYDIKIINFLYPINKPIGLGHQEDPNQLETYLNDHLINIRVELNLLQKITFFTLNRLRRPFWKLFNWIHQMIFGFDVFTPGKIDLKKYNLHTRSNQIIMAFGGPFSIFKYAYDFAELTNSKLILDYRDPWTFGYTPLDSSSVIYKLKIFRTRSLELKFLNQAWMIVTVSKTLRKLLPFHFQEKTYVFPNGCNFSENDIVINNKRPKTFNIVYAGTVYNDQLKDEIFFKAISQFIKDKDRSKIRLQFLGSLGNLKLISKLKKHQILEITQITSRLSNKDLLEYFNEASLFLHLRYHKRKEIISSKQADYLFFRKFILLPNSDNGDLAESIRENSAGFVCNSIAENLQVLEMLWNKFNSSIYGIGVENSLFNTRESIAKSYVEEILRRQELKHENFFR